MWGLKGSASPSPARSRWKRGNLVDASVPPSGGGHGEDGSGGGEGAAEPLRQPFATGYKKNSGDMMVYGGGAMTVLGVLAMVLSGQPAFLIVSVVGTLSALFYWPVVDVRTPQLGASAEGLYVARVGLIRWDAIRAMRVQRQALRTMRLATLVLELDPPLPDALANAERVPFSQRFTTRNTKVRPDRVEVTLHTLAMPPDAIEARLKAIRPTG